MKAVVGDDPHIEVFQQFNCAACGTKQTMEEPNVLHTAGKCEECGAITNLRKYGCNYMVYFHRKAQA
jgi:PHP family Zn ribbon phosphoesterase